MMVPGRQDRGLVTVQLLYLIFVRVAGWMGPACGESNEPSHQTRSRKDPFTQARHTRNELATAQAPGRERQALRMINKETTTIACRPLADTDKYQPINTSQSGYRHHADSATNCEHAQKVSSTAH